MQPTIDHRAAAEQENKVLLITAGGLGCFLLLCIILSALIVLAALVWTLEGNLGPSGNSLEGVGQFLAMLAELSETRVV
ncbi:MAG: hypothetical protein U9R25_14370 [Chloroflexota bacterium]|nr:hypothetical protein [Chloroflexota bacterium]